MSSCSTGPRVWPVGDEKRDWPLFPIQPQRQIGGDIRQVLQPDGDADEAFADTRAGAFLGAQATVGGGGGVGDGGLGVTQVSGDGEEACGVDDPPAGLPAAAHLEGDDAAAGALLAADQVVLGVGGQAGTVNARDGGVGGQPFGQGLGGAMISDAQRVSAQAQGPLQGGGAHAVVHHQEAAVGMSQVRQD